MDTDTDDLFRLGERLAQPCLYLSAAVPGQAIIGRWGGQEAVRAAGTRRAPWFDVSCGWLRQHAFPLEGYLTIYTPGATERGWLALTAPDGPAPAETAHGVALAGREGIALPHLDTIEAYIGTAIDTMVHRGRIRAEQVAAYDKHWWDTTFHSGWLTLGGWRMPWPEDDPDDDPTTQAFYEGERRLVLRTFQDAEPWVEVWLDGDGRLDVLPRIT